MKLFNGHDCYRFTKWLYSVCPHLSGFPCFVNYLLVAFCICFLMVTVAAQCGALQTRIRRLMAVTHHSFSDWYTRLKKLTFSWWKSEKTQVNKRVNNSNPTVFKRMFQGHGTHLVSVCVWWGLGGEEERGECWETKERQRWERRVDD